MCSLSYVTQFNTSFCQLYKLHRLQQSKHVSVKFLSAAKNEWAQPGSIPSLEC